MKKLLLIVSALWLGFSCSTGADELSSPEGERDAVTRDIPVAEFWRIILNYTSDFNEQIVPGNTADETIHKRFFATAYSYWLTEGLFGDADVYSPVYQLWRFEAEQSAAMGLSLDMGDEIDLEAIRQNVKDRLASIIKSVAARADVADGYLMTGEDFRNIYEQCELEAGSTFLTIRESLRRMLLWEIVEEYFGTSINSGTMYDEMDSIYDILSTSFGFTDPSYMERPYPGCFTFHDGIVYLTRQYPSLQMPVELLGTCLPALVGTSDPNTRQNFVRGLIDLFESYGNDMYAVAGGRAAVEKVFRSLACAAFIGSNNLYHFELAQNNIIITGLDPDEDYDSFTIRYTTNSAWTVISSSGVEVVTHSGGTNGVETSGYIEFYTLRNSTGVTRYDYIIIGYGNNQTETLHITREPDQTERYYLDLNPESFVLRGLEVDEEYDQFEINYETNSAWTIQSYSGVTVYPLSGGSDWVTTKGIIEFHTLRNDTGRIRNDYIVISYGNGLTRRVEITRYPDQQGDDDHEEDDDDDWPAIELGY